MQLLLAACGHPWEEMGWGRLGCGPVAQGSSPMVRLGMLARILSVAAEYSGCSQLRSGLAQASAPGATGGM